jgi:hypothetical protein
MPFNATYNAKPTAPISLTATADGGYTRMKLAWTETSNERKGYEIQRSGDGSTGWTFVNTVRRENWGQGVNYYTDTGLTRGNTYYYKVRGFNDAGFGRWSNVANDTVWALSDVTLYADYDANAGVFEDSGGVDPCEDGDGVWVMKDQANSYDLTQATVGARPSYQTNELNGLPIIRNASGDRLVASTAADWKFLHDGTEFATYIVFKTAAADPDTSLALLDTSGAGSFNHGLFIKYDDTSGTPRDDWIQVLVSRGDGTFEANIKTTDEAAIGAQWHVATVRMTSTTLELRIDGHFGQDVDYTPLGSPSASNPTYALGVGARGDDALHFVGDWARILFISGTVSDADHNAVQDYLSEEYDLFHNYYFDAASLVEHDVSDPDHNSFGGICIAPNGDLICAYRKGDTHTSIGADGILLSRVSTDGGTTWGSELTIWHYTDDGGGTDMWSGPTLTVLADNRVIMAVAKRESGSTVVDGIGYFESNDNGQSWSGPTVVDSSFTLNAVEGGGMLQLANGDLLFPHYGRDTGDTYRSCRVSRSQDGGATWAILSEMADGETDTVDYVEPGLVLLDNGDILCLIRENTNNEIEYCTSDDSGATWGALSYAAKGNQRCSPTLLSTGEVLDIQRHVNSGNLPMLMASPDGGTNWQFGHLFEDSPSFATASVVYGQIAQHGDGTVYCSYAVEPAGQASADVMFAKTSIS